MSIFDNDPQYKSIVDHRWARLARELHQKANVPLGPSGLDKVKQFQTYLLDYQINIVLKEHENALIYFGLEQEKKSIFTSTMVTTMLLPPCWGFLQVVLLSYL